jgi:hypothetical protein
MSGWVLKISGCKKHLRKKAPEKCNIKNSFSKKTSSKKIMFYIYGALFLNNPVRSEISEKLSIFTLTLICL